MHVEKARAAPEKRSTPKSRTETLPEEEEEEEEETAKTSKT
jgi:hypothetical protein